jgi:DNA-binding CsgD family transcriptional regulator/tetratricopeptide (TPR) repeat protein
MGVSMPLLSSTETVGREAERALLTESLARAAAGAAHAVLLIGDAGIGKTRLLAEMAATAMRRNALVLRGRGTEIEGLPPYLLFLEALRPFIASAAGRALHRRLGRRATAAGELFPELAKPGRSGSLPPEEARLRLFEAVGELIDAASAEQPVVLILDDLHWADAASLDLLCHLFCHRGLHRILCVGASREAEAEGNAALGRTLDRLNHDRLLTPVRLSPLSAEHIAALAADRLGGAVGGSLPDALYRHSEGNPFFAEELLQCWHEGGGLASRDGVWDLTAAFAPGNIPAGIAGAVRQRLARLASDVVRRLQIASLIGRSFEPELIAAVATVPVDAVEADLATACRSGLVRVDGEGRFAFAHDKTRECLQAEIPASRRRRWHGAIGDAIEARSAHRSPGDIAVLAFHFARSEDRGKAVVYALEAADDALSRYAAAAAIEHYRTALRLIGRDDSRQVEILLNLGKALLLADDPAQAADTCRRAYSLALRASDRPMAARAALGQAKANNAMRRWPAMRAILHESISLLGGEPSPTSVQALSELAGAEAILGESAAGIGYARAAQQQAAMLGAPLLEAMATRALGKLLTRMQATAAEGMAIVERALQLATIADDPGEMAACLFRVGYATLNAGQLRRCLEATHRRIELARRAQDLFQLYHARAWLAYMSALAGDWPEVDRLVCDLRAATARLTNQEPLSFILKAAGYCAYLRGDFATAEAAFATVEDIFDAQPGATLYRGLLGLAQLAAGNRERALTTMAENEHLLRGMPEGSVAAGPILVCLAEMALALDDRPRLSRCYEALLPFAGQYYWFLVDRVLGETAVMFGDWAAAERHLSAAENQAAREGMRPEQTLLLSVRAELELARGGSGSAIRARQALAAALRGFEALGMAAEQRRTRDRLRNLPPQPGVAPPKRLPAGLSGREAQVLGLVAAGLSNRQIARELALSDHTVANHLTSVFNKTGSSNRAAAAAFALRHGLAQAVE